MFHNLRHCAVTNLANAEVEMFLRDRKVKAEKRDAAMDTCTTYLTRPRLRPGQSLGIQSERRVGAEGGT